MYENYRIRIVDSEKQKDSVEKNSLSSFQIGVCSGILIFFMALSPILYEIFTIPIFPFTFLLFVTYLIALTFYGLPIFIFGLMGFIGYKVFSRTKKYSNKKLFLILVPILILDLSFLSGIFLQIPFFTGLENHLRFVIFTSSFCLLTFVIGGLVHYFKLKIFFSINETAFLLNIFIGTTLYLLFHLFTSVNNEFIPFIETILIMALPLGFFGYYVSRKLILKIKNNRYYKKQIDLNKYEQDYLKRLEKD